ncbi:amino acid adenylation domain-containing protein [Nocardia gipuzkoensis]
MLGSVVAAALAVAAAGASDVGAGAIAEAYLRVKRLLTERYPGIDIAPLEVHPHSQGERLRFTEDLHRVGADADPALLSATHNLIAILLVHNPAGGAAVDMDLRRIQSAALRVEAASIKATTLRVSATTPSYNLDTGRVHTESLIRGSRHVLAGQSLASPAPAEPWFTFDGVEVGGEILPSVPLSPAQSALWYAQRIRPDIPLTIAQYVDICGDLDVGALLYAIERFGVETQVGQVRLLEIDGVPHQLVDTACRPAWAYLDLRTEVESYDAALRWMNEHANSSIDIEHDPLITNVVLRIEDSRYIWYTRAHHLVIDGYAAMNAITRAAEIYTAITSRNEPGSSRATPLAEIYAAEDDYRDSPRFRSDREYWLQQMADVDEPVSLSGSVLSAATHAAERRRTGVVLDTELQQAILHAVDRHDTNSSSLVVAAVACYVRSITARSDIVLSLPVSARTTVALRRSAGMVSNVVPLRIRFDSNTTVSEVIRTAELQITGALRHQRYRHDDIRRDCGYSRETRGFFGPMVNIMLFHNELRFGDLVGRISVLSTGPVEDLSINLYNVAQDRIQLDFEANPRLYTQTAVDLHYARFLDFLRRFLGAEAHSRAESLTAITAAERNAVLHTWNATTAPHQGGTLASLFSGRAATDPLATAVEFGDHVLTYRDLDERTNRLARLMIERGAGPESVVGLCLQRGLDLVLAIYATIKTGAAFLPLDPGHPAERLAYSISAVDPVLLVVDADDEHTPRSRHRQLILSSCDLSPYDSSPITDADRRSPLRPDHLAYVIFTSGSTGRPKGVSVSHAAIVNRLRWMQHEYPLNGTDAVLQKTPSTFDVSIWEFFWPLQVGARLVLVAPEGHLDPVYLAHVIAENRITTLHFVPSMLSVFIKDANLSECRGLRRVFCSGEALPVATVREFHSALPNTEIHNLYGPTEAAVDVTYWPCTGTTSTIAIGSPMWNTQTYVLDAYLRPTPPGAIGELYLAGVQLARGYIGRPDLSADRFVANPFTPGTRMYRTGDLARWQLQHAEAEHGVLEYLGRSDFQIKVRGQRIELAEVETALHADDRVRFAVCLVHSTRTGSSLIAYVVAAPDLADQTGLTDSLLASLRRTLPAYMVPAALVVLDEVPLTPNGKLDRKRLPDPGEFLHRARSDAEPRSNTEKLIARVFEAVLQITGVGLDDSFFALGGNSLVAARAVARINAALGSGLTIRDLFEARTVAELSVRSEGVVSAPRLRLVPADRTRRIPLAPAQQRLWILNRLAEHPAAYNMPFTVRFDGLLDLAALRAGLLDVIERHESLRTTFPEHPEGPYQQIHPANAVPLMLDPIDAADTDIPALATEYAAAGFDLRSQPPVRAALLRVGTHQYVLLLVVHHICCDGWSITPLIRDLEFAISARLTNAPPQWTPLPVQYADFALWQLQMLGEEVDPNSLLSAQLTYWRSALAGLPDQLDLPLDRPRPRRRSPQAGRASFEIAPNIRRAVHDLAVDHGVSTFMVVHAVLAALLSRVCGSTDITIGTPVAGRGEPALDDLVGMFVNTLVLRTEVDSAAGFDQFLHVVRTADLDAFAHADVTFDRLVEVVNPDRSPTHHPLFQVVLSYEHLPNLQIQIPGIRTEVLPTYLDVSKFDLEVIVRDDEDGLPASIEFGYARDIFDQHTIEVLGRRFLTIMRAATEAPSTPVGDLEILDDDESAALVPIAGAPAEPAATLPRLLSETAARFPDSVAVRYLGVDTTYRELDELSNRLARALLARGAGPEQVIAIALPRGRESVVCVWAVTKTGAAYVPIDARYPGDRIAHMIDDSRAVLGLTSSAFSTALESISRRQARRRPPLEWLVPDSQPLRDELDRYSANPITDAQRHAPLRTDQLAYLIYTSGSTGEPKAVEITHTGLASLGTVQRDLFGVSDSSRTLHFSSPSFDASVLEMLLAFASGATMVIAPADVYGGAELAALLRNERVTHAFVTPAALATVPHEGLDDLQVVIVGGEACTEGLVETWTAGHRMHNMYGPTEATVAVTATGPMVAEQSVQLGVPVHGIRLYVLDNRLRPVPPGTPGELYLSGPGLARGYRGRSGLTAQRFPANPYGGLGERMYRTGDVVVVDVARNLRFLGRVDDQIKIRGFRIELNEIDQVLRRYVEVTSALTLVHTDEHGRLRLAAYVTVKGPVESADILDYARQLLPSYMVPASVTVVDEFPRTPVGKLDRDALPEPVFAPVGTAQAPRSDIEHALAAIFADVLGLEEVGRTESFFELGGNSLIATQAVDRVAAVLGPGLTVRDLFAAGTVAELARRFTAQRAEADLDGLLGGIPFDHRRGPRKAQAWCLTDDPIRAGEITRIGFAIVVPESAAAAPVDAEYDRLPQPVRLRVLLQSHQAFVHPVTHLALLKVDRTTDPIVFEVVPEREGVASLTFRIYLDRDAQLLQEVVVALPVEHSAMKVVMP